MKKVIFACMMLLASAQLFAQSLNDKITIKIEKTTDYKEHGYHDGFVFSISITEKIPIRMYAFGIYKASDNTQLDYLEKYTYGLQYGWATICGYTCIDDKESIYKSETNQWIITIKYINTDDGKEYVKNFITPLNSELNNIQLDEYKESTGIANPIIKEKEEKKTYSLSGYIVEDSYKGIIIRNGHKYINK